MTGKQPEALAFCWATELAMTQQPVTLSVTEAREVSADMQRMHSENETLQAGYDAARLEIESLHAQLEAIGAGGVSGPLVGRAALSANAGEPVAHLWQHCETGRTRIVMPDMIVDADASWQVVGPLYLGAAPPTAQAEGWRDIATAPKDGVFLVYMQDEVRPARRMQVADWHSNVKIVGGLFSFDCATVTHWMPLPPPPTSAEGVEHG